jgi:23S rRNA pseudouridine2605 synthase
MERLQKVLAAAGLGSRRKCEQLILAGRISVNGTVVTELGTKVNPQSDAIEIDGRPILSEKKVYVMFHKPKGVITSLSDPKGRQTVKDYLTGIRERVFPVGRLDYDSEGLLLLTNDGELANRLMHPKFGVPKTYLATVRGVPDGRKLDRLAAGIRLEDGMTQPAEVEYEDVSPDMKSAVIRITIHEGRNRQVRRMFEAIGHPVERLKRIGYGPLKLERLPRGKTRYLSAEEVEELKRSAGEAGKSQNRET